MGRSPYQSEKRRKELARLKKQEEKRQRRFNKKHEGEKAPDQPEGAAGGGSTPLSPTMEEGSPSEPGEQEPTASDKDASQSS
ncbi:MAG TPA: hypothetical protein VMM82_11720 [Spirochaetia bacterium]|nr:hypothetical protein [Spirochaetia bacterium]